MTQKYELKPIRPEDVDFSDFNPRGESERDILADPDFEQLKESVFKYGVLVPIVVHRKNGGKGGKPYRLVDGERRLRAALATKTKAIPAHVAMNETQLDDLVQAFHIHMLRKQWKAVAQAMALKRIIDELQRHRRVPQSELLDELRAATGCSETRLKALRRVIRFPESVLREVDDGTLNFSHLVQIEESFIELVKSRLPDVLTDIGEDQARRTLVSKARLKTLTSTRALMENIVPVVARASTAAEKTYAKQLLRKFIEQEDQPAEEVLQLYEQRFPKSGADWSELGNEVLRAAESLAHLISRIDTNNVREHPALTKKVHQHLLSLKNQIGPVLRRTGRVAA